ncbi:SRP72 RNA-binding domain protein [Ancylostoma ceylanicum]|uniref:Signal recognition particle subunit SRP72 n=1 Tax=Ancylostoma ceylanicum TaxID=53326 RepID=A0A0D6LYB1_9BILA|nr:SRP72 RNA-binding domain protein [Ancylostoma ceylanicum]
MMLRNFTEMTTEGGLRQCLTDLTRADTSGDYQKALQAANRIIRRYPKEQYAFKCKECAFERAYIFYRLEKNDEALEALEACDPKDHRALELKAQLCYRLDRFQIFRDLLRNHSDSYDDERKANYLAVQAQLEAMGVKQQKNDDSETFEQLYNTACQLIEAGNFDAALTNLDKAIASCRETLSEEGLDEDEIEDELAMLRVQRAFVLHKMGRKKEAIEIYKALQAAGPSDVSVMVTVSNNMASALKDQSLTDSRKKLKAALQLDQKKLSTRQRRTLMLNNALVLLHSNQREPCRRALDELVGLFGTSKDSRLIEAALCFRLNEFEKAVNMLSDGDLQMDLTRIHLMVNSGKLAEAVAALNKLPANVRLQPAVVSLAVSLLVSLERKDEALKMLNEAVAHTRDPQVHQQVLDQAALLESSRGNHGAAASYLEKLAEYVLMLGIKFAHIGHTYFRLDPNDIRVLCRLIRAYTDVDPKKAEKLSVQVFPETTEEGVDVDGIEESDWILYGEKYKQKKDAKLEVEDTEIVTRKLKNRKRKRKLRLPKNYDPNVPPDPERWLPKQERAAYKKKQKKNRDRDIGRGTQGSAATNPSVLLELDPSVIAAYPYDVITNVVLNKDRQ